MNQVLFLCTGNSARSQMAEAIVNRWRGEQWQAFSAGTRPAGEVHPLAIQALKEIGIDASKARSKSLDKFRDATLDLVITVCDNAAEECPLWLGQGKRAHISFPDPARGGLDDFREVRDDIRRRVIEYLDSFEPERINKGKKCPFVWSGGITLPTKSQVAEWIRQVATSTVGELS